MWPNLLCHRLDEFSFIRTRLHPISLISVSTDKVTDSLIFRKYKPFIIHPEAIIDESSKILNDLFLKLKEYPSKSNNDTEIKFLLKVGM